MNQLIEDLKAAADMYERYAILRWPGSVMQLGMQEKAVRLRAHADLIERVATEMKTCNVSDHYDLSNWADALRTGSLE